MKMRILKMRIHRLVLLALYLGACGGKAPLGAIDFQATFGNAIFSCDSEFSGVGTSNATVRPLDLRLYLHEVALLGASGEVLPITLEEDGTWQHDGVVLLDFEDGTGSCKTSRPQTNTKIRYTRANSVTKVAAVMAHQHSALVVSMPM